MLVDIRELESKTIFDFLKYIKSTFPEKTIDFLLLDKFSEPPKIRKQILKFISVFHPDK